MNGIATTLTSWNAGVTRLTGPPRATFTRLPRGSTVGQPNDKMQQRRVLDRTIALLKDDSPLKPIRLEEN